MDQNAPSTELFGSVPLFRGLEEQELKAIAGLSKEVSFVAGETIVKQGDPGLGFYVIAQGEALVKRGTKTISKLGKGGFFGEMALLDDQPRSADVVATEPTKCFVLLRWNFWSLVTKNQKVSKRLFQELARRLRATDEALSE